MRTETLCYRDGSWERPLPPLDSPETLLVVFAAPGATDAVRALIEAYPRAVITGCSTSGEITGGEITDDSVVVGFAQFERTRLARAETAIDDPSDSRAAGRRLAEQLSADDLAYVLVLSDGLKVNGTELVAGLHEVLPERVVVTGGLAGDGTRFAQTWVLVDGGPRSGAVSAVGFYGDRLVVGHGSRGGWDVFGPERRITRSEGNVLYELDGRDALTLYKEYLGERAAGLPATGLLFPLAIREREGERQLVRTILQIDEEARSLTFAGDVPEGWRAQLMRASFERLVDGAADAGVRTARGAGSEPTFAIAISCVGRRLVLGERTEEEVEATLDALPAGSVQIGFYSYGELSPTASGRCDLHNQTMTLTALRER